MWPAPEAAGWYWAKAGEAVRRRREQAGAPAAAALVQVPGGDVLAAPQPQVERRHRQHRVLVQQRGQPGDVVRLEGRQVPLQQLHLLRVQRVGRLALADPPRRQRRPGPLEGAVHRRHRGVQQRRDLVRLPGQHLAQDQHGPLLHAAGAEAPRRRPAGRIPAPAPSPPGRRSAGAPGRPAPAPARSPRAARSARPRPGAAGRRSPSGGPACSPRSAGPGRRWWRSGTATTAARTAPRTGRRPARRGRTCPARRPRRRRTSPACGSSSPSARPGTAPSPHPGPGW